MGLIIALHVAPSQSSLLGKVIHLLPLPAVEPRLVSPPVHTSVMLLLLRSTSKILFIQTVIVTASCLSRNAWNHVDTSVTHAERVSMIPRRNMSDSSVRCTEQRKPVGRSRSAPTFEILT